MYSIDYEILVGGLTSGLQRLNMVQSITVNKDIDQLAQTATVVIPSLAFNQSLDMEKLIKVGDYISINLGYDNKLYPEFIGFVEEVKADEGTLTLNCMDQLYQAKIPVPDIELNDVTLEEIAIHCLRGSGITKVKCTYNLSVQKFVIKNTNAFDVLRQLKQETHAYIYMTPDNVLRIHESWSEFNVPVVYDFQANVESSNLKYVHKDDKPLSIEITAVGKDGKPQKVKMGDPSGETISLFKTALLHPEAIKQIATNKLMSLVYDGYDGSITTWLDPYVEPTYLAVIWDRDYPLKTGMYYIKAVQTTASENGGRRVVTLGKKFDLGI